MFSEIGNLKDYWHVIALTSELKPGRSLKRTLYDHPFLLWRDRAGRLHALTDSCAHRKTPVEVIDYGQNKVVCPYHGWQYDATGNLTHIPSAPDACGRLKCSIDHFSVIEADGFVWIGLGRGTEPTEPRPNLDNFAGREWRSTFKMREFQTTETLLVDNFMDPTHTGVVHDGLIRSQGQERDHHLTVTTSSTGVRVDFDEEEESVGFGARLLFGKTMKVRHTDEFLLPNLVRVVYHINGETRFVAFIACSPLSELSGGRTIAFVHLKYRFGLPGRLFGPALSLLAGKVLQQDARITEQQFANMQRLPQTKETLIAADAVGASVTNIRDQIVRGESPAGSERRLQLRF